LDSFSYNIVHLLESILSSDFRVEVLLYDDLEGWGRLEELAIQRYSGIIIGPGPGKPSDYPRIHQLIRCCKGEVPFLGICLGMQILGELLGFEVSEAPEAIHGKMRLMNHSKDRLFQGIESPMEIGRYHSLCIQLGSVNRDLDFSRKENLITAYCDGIPMALTADDLLWDAVQFHPESVLTPNGKRVLENWVAVRF